MRSIRVVGCAVAVLAGTALPAPPSALAATPSLRVQVGESDVVPSRGAVVPGQVRLTVENVGRRSHALEIVPTTTWGGRALRRVAAPPVVVEPGRTRSVRVTLMPGFYLLLERGPWRAAVPLLVAR